MSEHRPLISIATNNAEMGGGEVMLLRIADALRALSWPLQVVAPSGSEIADAATDAGFSVVPLAGEGRLQWMRALRRWSAQAGSARGIVWCNGLVPAVATAGQPARIVHVHQKPLSAAQRALVPVARFGAMSTVVPSRYMQRFFAGSTVLPNWTPAVPTPARVRSAGKPFVIGFLGRLSTDKGVVVLADALRDLQRRRPGAFRAVIAGEPRFVDAADFTVVDAALAAVSDVISRPGWMDRDEFFAAVDVLVMPSQWGEPFGLGAVEAMSARVPVVVSADGALPDIVGGLGMTFPPGDAAALADALAALADGAGAGAASGAGAGAGAGSGAGTGAASGAGVAVRPLPDVTDELHARWERLFSPVAGTRAVGALLESLRP